MIDKTYNWIKRQWQWMLSASAVTVVLGAAVITPEPLKPMSGEVIAESKTYPANSNEIQIELELDELNMKDGQASGTLILQYQDKAGWHDHIKTEFHGGEQRSLMPGADPNKLILSTSDTRLLRSKNIRVRFQPSKQVSGNIKSSW